MTENLFKEFYDGLNDEKNKLNEDNIINFQDYDFFKEINEGNKKVNLNDIIGAKIEKNTTDENKNKKEKIDEKEDKKEDKNDEKKEEEEEEEGEDEEGGEVDDNEEK